MRIVVTGRDGQVARSLGERAADDRSIQIVTLARPQLDLAKPETIEPAIAGAKPDIVVSAAAYTAVDQAEDEPDLAHAINAIGAGAVAAAAARAGAPLIHLSTDYVFSGDKDTPYTEDDVTAPQGAYGRSKLAGEEAVAATNPHNVILRTAWVYSPFGRNFARTMLRLAGERDKLSVVADQVGNPTSALDIADAVLHIAARLGRDGSSAPFGLYHLAGGGSTSWHGFAEHIFSTSGSLGGPSVPVEAITTAQFPTKATRPANSRLATDRLKNTFGWQPPRWQDSCDHVIERLVGVPSG